MIHMPPLIFSSPGAARTTLGEPPPRTPRFYPSGWNDPQLRDRDQPCATAVMTKVPHLQVNS